MNLLSHSESCTVHDNKRYVFLFSCASVLKLFYTWADTFVFRPPSLPALYLARRMKFLNKTRFTNWKPVSRRINNIKCLFFFPASWQQFEFFYPSNCGSPVSSTCNSLTCKRV